MSDGTSGMTLAVALMAGIAGSAHCVAMCGGVAGALSMRARATINNRGESLRDAGLYHAGRIGGYAVAGYAFGFVGVALESALDFSMLMAVVRFAAALLIVLIAARILLGWNTLAAIERLGARFWRMIQPLVRRAAVTPSHARSLILGLLWGWLPCGLVYSMLLFAALNATPLHGAAIMVAFGIGTLPAMLASSLFASRLTAGLRRHGTRQMVGALLLVFGIWLGWAAMMSARHVHHGHVLQTNDV
jgi:uncharacterized protein